MNLASYITLISPLLIVIIGTAFFGWNKIQKETNRLLREQNVELKDTVKELTAERLVNVGKLASLQGQIDVLKSIPLSSIDTTLKEMSNTNSKILETLQSSATALVKDTKAAAKAVEQVKTDLDNTN